MKGPGQLSAGSPPRAKVALRRHLGHPTYPNATPSPRLGCRSQDQLPNERLKDVLVELRDEVLAAPR